MTWLAVLQVTLYNPEAVLLHVNMLPYAAGCSYTRHATGRGRVASLPYWVWQNTCIPVAAGMKPETSSILGTDLHYALAEAAQALYMLWCCTIACSSSAQLAVLLLCCMFLISPIGCVAAVQCSLLAHYRCTSYGNKSRMGSRPSQDAPEHWFWVPPGSSLTRSCRLPSHSVTMPASDQHVLMEVMLCHFSVPCMRWRLPMAWIYSTMNPEAASIDV